MSLDTTAHLEAPLRGKHHDLLSWSSASCGCCMDLLSWLFLIPPFCFGICAHHLLGNILTSPLDPISPNTFCKIPISKQLPTAPNLLRNRTGTPPLLPPDAPKTSPSSPNAPHRGASGPAAPRQAFLAVEPTWSNNWKTHCFFLDSLKMSKTHDQSSMNRTYVQPHVKIAIKSRMVG